MDRHSSYIFIWLQLELCAMAVLLTKGEIRCYCDAATLCCNRLMCKSELSNTHSPLTHGCLDSIANMCNYRGLHDVLSPSREIRYQHDSSRNLITKVQELTSSKELWFRAAVIAVPIAGGLILVLLIMLALRMLRTNALSLHYSFHGHHSKKGRWQNWTWNAWLPVTGHENCCMTCDKMRHSDLSNDKILSLVHWGMYSGHGKLEFV
uniref:BMP and activin membrane bound inhibitor n=1 Tax=Catharus ustulatus TaxID=91951 RepID=A0A8C3UQS2_CATUS